LEFGYYTGLPTIEPTIVVNYEASWSRSLPKLGATLRVAAFHGHSDDIVASTGGIDLARGLFGFPVNMGDSQVSGLEIAVKGQHENWRWGAGYSPLDIADEFAAGFTVANTRVDFERSASRHVLTGNLGWARGPWEVDGYFQYRSSADGIMARQTGELQPIPSYVTVDARVGYRLNDRMSVALSSQGLTRSERRETAAGAPVERRVLGTFRIAF
jgi:iron complex outermembrane receptor protein